MNEMTSVPRDVSLALKSLPREKSHASTAGREHIAYIEYFRALAIILIVAGHTFMLAGGNFADENLPPQMSLMYVFPALINGGTAYFVFISGFLYRQVFFDRVSYGDFMKKKLLYVGLPYLVLATPLSLIEILSGAFSVTTIRDGVAYPHSLFIDFIVLMATGRMVTAYWYIPFVFLIFLAAPLFDRFIRLEQRTKWLVFAATLAVAFWIHRPADNLNPIQSFAYFTNIYLFGILFCEYRATIIAVVTRRPVLAVLAILMFAVAAVQVLAFHRIGNIERGPGDGWMPMGFDFMLVQKYIGILLFCGLFARWGKHMGRLLSFVAANSFGLYFVHGVVIAVLTRLLAKVIAPHLPNPVADLVMYTVIVLAISIACVVVVKQVTGRYSRYIIGS